MPLFFQDTDYQLQLTADISDLFDDPQFTDEDIDNMVDEIRSILSH